MYSAEEKPIEHNIPPAIIDYLGYITQVITGST